MLAGHRLDDSGMLDVGTPPNKQEPSNGKKNVITKKDRCILKTKKETDDPMINNRLQELSH